ncbi:hypothetical protein AF332_19760 [Sporosarcina globispora]|uniref:YokE-like PH domain-containing protein n=1 Tax=Sporosarcina globispora TaxID=1459 RepID=A0A0M0GH52_SPOGL|nr:PH domain-containing protein [Sporosarcina globispora]KON88817.1 hypothetical protein AF332_19760 [Sporosarcina globispora]
MNLVKNPFEQLLKEGENIIECICCSLVAHFCLVPQAGFLIATNKRLLFCAITASEANKGFIQEFTYRNIISIAEKRGITGKHIHMYYNQDLYKFQQIQGMNMFEFMIAVKDKMRNEP